MCLSKLLVDLATQPTERIELNPTHSVGGKIDLRPYIRMESIEGHS